MGQDTYCTFGVSVQVTTKPENRELLARLVSLIEEERKLQCYVATDYDEVIDLTYTYKYEISDEEPNAPEEEEDDERYDERYLSVKMIRKLAKATTPEEYNQMISGRYLTYYFMIPFVSASARNISRRDNASLFEDTRDRPSHVIQTINRAVSVFTKEGIPENQITIGSHFMDSC